MQMDKNQKNMLKQTFKNYRNMTASTKRTLASMGIQAEKRKKHWILKYGNKIFICPTTASDHRAGMNLALEICRELSEDRESIDKTEKCIIDSGKLSQIAIKNQLYVVRIGIRDMR